MHFGRVKNPLAVFRFLKATMEIPVINVDMSMNSNILTID